MKICAKCKETKDYSEFNIAREKKDGYYPYCRECVKEYRKSRGIDRYAYNPESHKARQKRFRARHKTYERNFRRVYLKTIEGKCSKLLASSKSRAAIKSLEFDLDYDWIMQRLSAGKCEASGIEFDYTVPEGQHHGDFVPSIDRIDNNKGYTKDNCWVVCLMINRAKGQGPWANVVILAKGIVEKLNEQN